jgi:glycosyltransferase involved in cell wall biosynthesis
VVTGEYPPQPGGVSDYTRRVAEALAGAGDRVDVWAPGGGTAAACAAGRALDRLTVHRLPDRFGRRSLAILERALSAGDGPWRLLVQYVPQAFGWKGANVPFCRWLASRRRDDVWIMFHEVSFPTGREYTVGQNLLGLVNQYMAHQAASAAARVFVSVPAWRPRVEPQVRPDAHVEWLPIPSAIPVAGDANAVAAVRSRHARDAALVGHFGTYGALVRPLLDAALGSIARSTQARVLLIGRGSLEAAADLAARDPAIRGRIAAAGELSAEQVSSHLAACDVLVQPYPDGVSTRRTSAMAALAHGTALVTTEGALSEPLWAESGAVLLAPAAQPAALGGLAAGLLADPARRDALGAAGRALYRERFSLRHTIEVLRS